MRHVLFGACAMAVSFAPAVTCAASFTVLHDFAGGKDGAVPLGGSGGFLTLDNTGALYGPTVGSDVPTDYGTIFKLTPPPQGQNAWSENVLYRLKGGKAGASPGSVLFGASGVSYGAAFLGGGTACVLYGATVGCGLIYQLTPPAPGKKAYTLTTLYKFQGAPDGDGPAADLVADSAGNLYGMTGVGGTGPCTFSFASAGCGTVFELAPPAPGKKSWTEKIVYSFQGGSDGSLPQAGLAIGSDGTLYGMTAFGGGPANAGTVFSLTPPAQGQTVWTETILYGFQGGSDGALPGVPPVFDRSGALLGTTFEGGASGLGTIFELVPPAKGQTAWTETVLHAFTGGADGAYPNTGLTASLKGAFVTTTTQGGTGNCTASGTAGCGALVRIAPPAKGQTAWKETVLHSLDGASDGAAPFGGLTADAQGNLYGAAAAGGSGNCPNANPVPGCGTVFEYVP